MAPARLPQLWQKTTRKENKVLSETIIHLKDNKEHNLKEVRTNEMTF